MMMETLTTEASAPEPEQNNLSERETMLANLAALVNSIAREIDLRIEPRAEMAPMTPLEISVMSYLDEHSGATPCEAARDVGLQRSNLSAILRTLTAKRLIESRPDQQDGRKVHLYSTAEAKRNLVLRRASWARILAEAVSGDEPLRPCLTALKLVNAALTAQRRRRATPEQTGC
jgi:DNA-binding MarR family transcriptional regulator